MNKVYACIDGVGNTAAVVDAAAWSARRLDCPLEFLHVLERHPERAQSADYSGAIGLGAHDALLQELSALDEQRGRLAQEAGRRLLASARERAAAAGLDRLDGRLRHGDLAETALDLAPDARLLVLGEHDRHRKPPSRHLDHHVERVVRTVGRPVLVVPGASFIAPDRVVIAFDGSATARRTVDLVAGSPLLAGLPVLLARAGPESPSARGQREDARCILEARGFSASTELLEGEPEEALLPLTRVGRTLLVMGAYGHSRVRALIVGSTTTILLRTSEVPVLVLR